MGAPLAAVVPPLLTEVSFNGADLLGWSALPLLGSSTGGAEPWLFVTSRSSAWLSRGPLADARFVQMAAAYNLAWPFADKALAGVIVDGEGVRRSAGGISFEHVLAEACRVTAGEHNVLVVCSDRLLPKRLRNWREYGWHSAREWRRAATQHGRCASTVGSVRLESNRVTDLIINTTTAAGALGIEDGSDRIVLGLSRAGDKPADALQLIVGQAARDSGIDLHVDRTAVRKIGKTAVFLSGADGRRYIMRIARSPIARARAIRNFDVLASLHRMPLPRALTARVPQTVIRGSHAGYEYFVEHCLAGASGPAACARERRADGWAVDALEYITSMHRATAQPVLIDDDVLQLFVLEPIRRLRRACQSATADRVLECLAARCERALHRRILPLVRTHGDFTESNCLFDNKGYLTGVIDWEVSEAAGLPLADLLQLMPVANETSSHPRWQRCDAWLELWRHPDRVDADDVMGRYIRKLDIALECVPALILLQWVTHVADRVEARQGDERWLRLRLRQPLESLGRMLS